MSQNPYRTFYGEFSLRQWVKMILNKEIILPEFQRSFAWSLDSVKKLAKSFNEGFIIPPVIIAQKGDNNYILDGQQRLTSILLTFFNIFPQKNQDTQVNIYNQNESSLEGESEEDIYKDIVRWDLSHIQKAYEQANYDISELIKHFKGNTIYKEINYNIGNNFWDEKFLGYTFAKENPGNNHQVNETCFAQTFHIINTAGSKLLPLESRRAYYWLKPDLSPIFEPEFTKNIFIEYNKKNIPIDFVRPLAFAANYYKINGENLRIADVARGYRQDYEKYFTDFVLHIAEFEKKESIFGTLSSNTILQRIVYIDNLFKENIIPRAFSAIYEYDYYFFGLVYWIVIQGETITKQEFETTSKHINKEIEQFRLNNQNTTKYNTLGQIRYRLHTSIKTYSDSIKFSNPSRALKLICF